MTYVVHEVAHTAEGENEEVYLLDEKALAGLIRYTEVFPQPLEGGHGR